MSSKSAPDIVKSKPDHKIIFMFQRSFSFRTNHGRAAYEITGQIQSLVEESDCGTGLCHVFVHHTSASLMLCENADPTVLCDLDTFMAKLAPDGAPEYTHYTEGPDDMPAHIRTVITQTGITIPVTNGRCKLGTWQGIFLWEHRQDPHDRNITVSVW